MVMDRLEMYLPVPRRLGGRSEAVNASFFACYCNCCFLFRLQGFTCSPLKGNNKLRTHLCGTYNDGLDGAGLGHSMHQVSFGADAWQCHRSSFFRRGFMIPKKRVTDSTLRTSCRSLPGTCMQATLPEPLLVVVHHIIWA